MGENDARPALHSLQCRDEPAADFIADVVALAGPRAELDVEQVMMYVAEQALHQRPLEEPRKWNAFFGGASAAAWSFLGDQFVQGLGLGRLQLRADRLDEKVLLKRQL